MMGCHPYIACLEQAVLTLLLGGGLHDVEISGCSPSVILSGDCLRSDPKLLAEACRAAKCGLRKERKTKKRGENRLVKLQRWHLGSWDWMFDEATYEGRQRLTQNHGRRRLFTWERECSP